MAFLLLSGESGQTRPHGLPELARRRGSQLAATEAAAPRSGVVPAGSGGYAVEGARWAWGDDSRSRAVAAAATGVGGASGATAAGTLPTVVVPDHGSLEMVGLGAFCARTTGVAARWLLLPFSVLTATLVRRRHGGEAGGCRCLLVVQRWFLGRGWASSSLRHCGCGGERATGMAESMRQAWC
jgi:hypothetical protein